MSYLPQDIKDHVVNESLVYENLFIIASTDSWHGDMLVYLYTWQF